jgi:hypothetical protein
MGMTSYMFQEHDKLQGVANVGNKTAWARDRGASISKRGLTLTLVTLSEDAGPLLSRTRREFHDQDDDLHTAFPLKKISPFYL